MLANAALRRIPGLPRAMTLLLVLAATIAIQSTRQAMADHDAATAHRKRLVMAQPPHNAQQVLAVRKQLTVDRNRTSSPPNRDVVVVGQIGGMPNVWPDTHPDFPWYPGQASFFLVDSQIARQFAQHAKHHGGGECTFCQQLAAKNVYAIAVVNLVDENGKLLAVDTRELVDLKENETVTLRGRAKLLGGSMLVIDADGIFVNRQPTATRAPERSRQ